MTMETTEPKLFGGFDAMQETFRKFSEGIHSLHSPLQKSISILADHGWYVTKAMSLGHIFDNAKSGIENNKASIDTRMIKYYRKNKKSIIKSLCLDMPDRAEIIREGLKCHDKKFYSASVSLFLSQSDGILSGKLFLIKKDKKSLTTHIDNSIHADFLKSALATIRGIDCWTGDVNKHQSDLNRHAVMHGYSVDYGKEINSLKTLSLLAFVGDFYRTT